MALHQEDENSDIHESKLYKVLSRFFHVTKEIRGEHFFVKEGGKHYIFAFDSIPAIFLITQDVFVIYTSNIFAILGLRALYFLLAAAVNQFTCLKPALSIILIFIGCKIFLPYIGLEISAMQSLCVTLGLISGGIVLSLYKPSSKA